MITRYKYTIKTDDKLYEFKTLKSARAFSEFLEGITIIAQVRI